MIQLNPSVGVAPGTTTIQLSDCPPNEPWHYTVPPDVVTGFPSGMTPPATAGAPSTALNPYATESQLRGLGLASPNWGFIVLAGLVAFLGVLGFSYWQRHRKK